MKPEPHAKGPGWYAGRPAWEGPDDDDVEGKPGEYTKTDPFTGRKGPVGSPVGWCVVGWWEGEWRVLNVQDTRADAEETSRNYNLTGLETFVWHKRTCAYCGDPKCGS